MMTSADTTGPEPPANNSGGYDSKTLSTANQAERVVPVGIETTSVLLRAGIGNGGIVYLGFNDNVTTANGMPLEAGDTLSLDIDVAQQEIWGVPDTGGDELRWLALG